MPPHAQLNGPPRHHPPHPPPEPAFFEALATYDCKDVAELDRLVAQYRPDLLPLLHSIVPEVTTDPYAARELLRIYDARLRLETLHDLLQLAIQSKLAAILPLPPHIADHLISLLPATNIFASEDELPPHFPRCIQLDTLMPAEIVERLGTVEAFAVDGFEEGNGLLMRRSVVRVLQMLPHQPRLYFHSLPHRPHHADLALFVSDDSNLMRI